MMRRRHFPIFYIVYFTLIVLFGIALFTGLHIVREYLSDYEASLPQYEAQRVFDTYYADGDFTALLAKADCTTTVFESDDAILRWLQNYTKNKTISFTGIKTGLTNTLKYIVKADDVKFSAFTLRESGQTSEKGFSLYEPDSFELYCAGNESITITAPEGYDVYVNDILLDASYRTDYVAHDISWDHLPDGVHGITFVAYHLDGLYFQPASVSVISPDGQDCAITASEDTYSAAVAYSDILQAAYSDYVIEAAQAISAYMQNDGRLTKAAAYIDRSSDLYVNLRTSETYFVIPHESYSFENIQTSEFYAYDENTFSCRVSFTHVLSRKGNEDYHDYIDTTFFLHRVGNQFLIYDRYNH